MPKLDEAYISFHRLWVVVLMAMYLCRWNGLCAFMVFLVGQGGVVLVDGQAVRLMCASREAVRR